MRVNCVGAIVFDDAGRLLLIQRGRPPGEGLWSLPGGRVDAGETDAEALARELAEETGLRVAAALLAGTVDRPGPSGVTYVIRDYHAVVTGGRLRPGDDARDARWCTAADLHTLPLTDGLVTALRSWQALPD
ncbi:NUDIX hydrolase [Nonomuraea longicatena]|uniref:NUDIX domain-containing protein n=1 Tax=Nonomuraea longicatena TaxID=83682 RepID=A0ABN1R107_9ACTN